MSDAAATIHDPQRMRHAGRELLSLAFIDARNRTLRWLAAFAQFDASPVALEFDPPHWLVGNVAWFQENSVARNVRRTRGEPPVDGGLHLASIEPRADSWFDPSMTTRQQRWQLTEVGDADLRDYLAATFDTTAELLERSDESDAGLRCFRLALWYEDRCAETLAELAQASGLASDRQAGLWPGWPARARRDALWLPAQRWSQGSAPGGWVPDNERQLHDEAVPEFEIDAQAVQWSQFVEFVEDGGYDDPRWWTESGWSWVVEQERRAPRYVEQLSRGVLVQRQGQVQRVSSAQAAMHLSWFEADAWCRWAGRRLPTEVEWELAACTGAARGFVWGDVFEWTAGRAGADAGDAYASAHRSRHGDPIEERVARGASAVTVARLKHPRARRAVAPGADASFVGFRSCAL
jgi:formylglycine-generating enzyme required for sulfatase activity